MPDLPPLLAANGDATWLTFLVSGIAILTSVLGWLRMVWSQGKFTGTIEQRMSQVEKDHSNLEQDIQRDRRDSWDAINKSRDSIQECREGLAGVKAAHELWLANSRAKASDPGSPGRRSHPKDVT